MEFENISERERDDVREAWMSQSILIREKNYRSCLKLNICLNICVIVLIMMTIFFMTWISIHQGEDIRMCLTKYTSNSNSD